MTDEENIKDEFTDMDRLKTDVMNDIQTLVYKWEIRMIDTSEAVDRIEKTIDEFRDDRED